MAESTISYVRSGASYKDVAAPQPQPATPEQLDRLRRRMREVGIDDRFVQFVLSRVERSGRLRIPAKEAEAFGIAVWPRTVAITIARRHHLLRQAGRQIYEAAVDMPEGTWQSHFEDLVLSQHQREVLSVRVSRAIAVNDEIPSCVVDSIVDATSLDGRFDKGAITGTAFSSTQSRVIMRLLLCGGVVEEVSRRTLVFVDMPGRTHTHGREGARVKPVEPSSSGYREAVRMLVRGDDLSAVAYESGVPAAIAQKMAKALSVDTVTRLLLASGKQSQLPRLLGLPEPAAKAIAEHVSRSNHTSIQSTIR
ncbi:hypothetical protein [Rhodopirellula bahusiensis]|uniref:hypothetical protein n=1 Tax=Rhodopirellula bahusiensis TaxID=2014065 RepID=UPI0032642365